MKRFTLLCGVLLIGWSTAASAADPSVTAHAHQQALKLIKEIQAQQAAIADNQARIDAKVASLGEQIQLSKVFAGRAAAGR